MLLAQLQQMLCSASEAAPARVERETASIVEWISGWQSQLLAFDDIGQLFAPGQKPLDPTTTSRDFRLPLKPAMVGNRSELLLFAHGGDDRPPWNIGRDSTIAMGLA